MVILELGVSYWAYIGTFYLLWMTWQDYRNNMTVDDRKNYFMMGVSIALISWYTHSIFYLLGLALVIFLFNLLGKKYVVMGEADLSCLSWLIMGLGIIDLVVLLIFIMILSVMVFIFIFFKWFVFKRKDEPVPFFGVILICYIVNMFLFGFY